MLKYKFFLHYNGHWISEIFGLIFYFGLINLLLKCDYMWIFSTSFRGSICDNWRSNSSRISIWLTLPCWGLSLTIFCSYPWFLNHQFQKKIWIFFQVTFSFVQMFMVGKMMCLICRKELSNSLRKTHILLSTFLMWHCVLNLMLVGLRYISS